MSLFWKFSQYCLDISPNEARLMIARDVKRASSSFYWAMRFLPQVERNALFSIYFFCRSVDDIADDMTLPADERSLRLEGWRREINALYAGHPSNAFMEALRQDVVRFSLARDDFLAMIEGMEMDASGPIVAPSFLVFDHYCACVASSVGRMCVHVFGERGVVGKDLAHALGRALQITNILRDISEDAALGRVYLPREILERYDIAFDPPSALMRNRHFARAWREVSDLALEHFKRSEGLFKRLPKRSFAPARIMMEVYRRNLMRMRSLEDSEISNPQVSKRLLGKKEALWVAFKIGFLGQ